MSRSLLLALAALTLGAGLGFAPADDGWDAKVRAFCQVRKGSTTLQQAEAAMGRPTATVSTPSGVVMVSYRRFPGPGGPKNPMIGLGFGPDGKLVYAGTNEAVAPCPASPAPAEGKRP